MQEFERAKVKARKDGEGVCLQSSEAASQTPNRRGNRSQGATGLEPLALLSSLGLKLFDSQASLRR